MSEILKIDPYGFREYDARWVYEKDINHLGITNLGRGLGTQIISHTKKNNPKLRLTIFFFKIPLRLIDYTKTGLPPLIKSTC